MLGQGHFLTLAPWHLYMEIELRYSKKLLEFCM